MPPQSDASLSDTRNENSSARPKTYLIAATIIVVSTLAVVGGIAMLPWSMPWDATERQRSQAEQQTPELPLPTAQPLPLQTGKNESYYADAAKRAWKDGNLPALKRIVDEGLKAHPNSPDLWSLLGAYHLQRPDADPERPDRALAAVKRALELAPDPARYANVGWIYQEMKQDYSAALQYYEGAEREGYAKQHPTLYHHMASCYVQLGNRYLAKRYYRLFLEKAPNHEYAPSAKRFLDDDPGLP